MGQAVEERSCFVEEEFCDLLQEWVFWLEMIDRRGKECEDAVDYLPDSLV